jgi:hypothetical protein
MMVLAVGTVLGLAMVAPRTSAGESERGMHWQGSIPITFTSGASFDKDSTSVDVHDDLGWGFGFGYHLDNRFEVGVDFTWLSANYDVSLATDINNDGLMDLFVANDTVQNFLFVNRGEGKFEEIGLMAEVAYSEDGRPRSGMGVDSADFNGDGWADLFVANVDQADAARRRVTARYNVAKAAGNDLRVFGAPVKTDNHAEDQRQPAATYARCSAAWGGD